MGKDVLSINLLENKAGNTIDTILKWALYVGRLLIILTESIALFVFFSRFSLDRKLIDLNDDIKRKQAMIGYFKKSEDTYRKAQQQLNLSKTNTASSSAVMNLYEDMVRRANDRLDFTNLIVTPTFMTLTVQSQTVDILTNFTQQLKNHPLITSLSIDQVENKSANALINITITAQLRKKGT